MASLDVIALDPVTPQLRAPGVGDTYHFCRVVEFQDGTDAAPSITNVGDANTGIYWPNADELAVSTGGVQRMSLGATTVFNETGADVDFRVEGDTDANLLFVDASTDRVGLGLNNPDRLLDVDGSSKFRGQILITSGEPLTLGLQALQLPTGTESTIGAGLSTRTGVAGESIIQFGNNMNTYYTGSVNAAKPGAMIRIDTRGVEPTPGASAYSVFQIQTRAAGVADPNYTVPVQIGAAPQGTFCIQTNGLATFNYGFVVNEGGGDYDTRFEGDTDTHLFFADASTDRIGIGTASPAFKLDVAGTGKVSALYLTDMTAGSGALYYSVVPDNRLTLANYNVGGTIFFETNGGAYAGAIDASQNWGIGTTTPNVRLDVNGAMRLRGSTSGYVGLQAAAVAGTTTYTLPSADGSNGQVLTTNGTGTLSWTTNAGGDVTGPASASDNAIARFDGTTGKLIQNSAVFVDDDGDVGIGTSTPGEKLQIESGTPRIYINATTNSASAGMYFRVKDGSGNADNSGIYLEPTANIANRYINFSASNIGSDMAIRAGGNVGIGTISPAQKLDVSGAIRSVVSTGGTLLLGDSNNTTGIRSIPASGDSGIGFYTQALNANNLRMTLDASGNLGLGVTPSAWGSGFKAIQISTGGGWMADGANSYFSANSYWNGTNWIRNLANAAARYQMESGIHSWYIAPPGTAGNVISFTQAMTLDASGNLLVGATSLAFAEKFRMYGNYAVFDNASYTGFIGQGSSLGTATASDFAIRSSNALAFLSGGATERMRLDSSGNLGIGTSSPGMRLDVQASILDMRGLSTTGTNYVRQRMSNTGGDFYYGIDGSAGANFGVNYGAVLWYTGNYPMVFATNNIERARITAAGLVGIGTSSPESILHIAQASSGGLGAQLILDNTASSTLNSAVEISFLTDGGASGSGTRNARIRVVNENATLGSANLQFWTWNGSADAERARITSDGSLCVGQTTVPANGASGSGTGSFSGVINCDGLRSHAGSGGAYQANNFNFQWTGNPILWVDTTNVGQIATVSDYRLKENITSIAQGAVDRVMQLKPIKFNRKEVGIFKGSDQVEEGFLAHELQAVIPSAVLGDKDALTKDGRVQPQSLNWSPLVSVLVKAIQELKAELDATKAKVAALEVK